MKQFLMVMFILLLTASAESATFDPAFSFSTLETTHFFVYYHQGLKDLAKRAASIAEEVHAKLSPLLGWLPEEKTNLVLADSSDIANGQATALPWNAIYLQPVPPAVMSTLGEYDDWLRILIIHEYAHILTSDPVRGYSRVTRRIFGKTYPTGDVLSLLFFVASAPPNIMMPRWWHEGMATWSETELSSAGRGRSSFYDMIYRTAVAENNLPTIDLINGDVPYWPDNNLPYIFGSRLIQYLAGTFGKNVPGDISVKQSGRVPYFINGPPEELLDSKDYADLYREMLAKMVREQKELLARLATSPLTPLRKIGRGTTGETFPRLSPDGKLLAFNRDDRHNRPNVVISDLDGVEQQFFEAEGNLSGSLSWDPSGKSIYFSQTELVNNVDTYNDIYCYDLQREQIVRLTHALRASEPDISPDGRTLAVIITGQGSQNLALLDVSAQEKGSSNRLPKMLTSYSETGVAAPRWSPDGKNILFVVKDNNSKSSLNLFNLATGEVRKLFSGKRALATPSWSRDGSMIYYSSDETGVFNIFAWSIRENSAYQITNVISGAFSPNISPDNKKIIVSHYTAAGFTVALVENPEGTSGIKPSPSIIEARYPVNHAQTDQTATSLISTAEITPTPYSAGNTLIPRFWLPALIADGPSGIAPGLMTGGQDVLGYHSFTAGVYYGTDFNKTYLDTIYRYDRYTPSFSLQGYLLPSTYSNLLGHGDYTELEKGIVTQVALPFKKLYSELSLVAGYRLNDQQALSPLVNDKFDGLPVFQGRNDSFFTGLDYSNSAKYPWSIATETGRIVSGRLNYFGKASGSELASRTYTLKWEEYFGLPRHHTIMVRLNGGLAEGEKSPQQAFQLGGLTTQLNPFGLRGYESRFATGDYIATSTLEYRFPAWYFFRGIGTKPIFFDRLHGALFVEAGEVWKRDKGFNGNEIKTGAGTEIRFDMTLGYWLKISPAIGYAHGFNRDGIDQIYFTIYTNL